MKAMDTKLNVVTKNELSVNPNVSCETNRIKCNNTNAMDGNATEPIKSNVKGVLNYFSIFNVQGLKTQTIPSTLPYIKDLLIEKNQLFMASSET